MGRRENAARDARSHELQGGFVWVIEMLGPLSRWAFVLGVLGEAAASEGSRIESPLQHGFIDAKAWIDDNAAPVFAITAFLGLMTGLHYAKWLLDWSSGAHFNTAKRYRRAAGGGSFY
jgi:hypothetical protein